MYYNTEAVLTYNASQLMAESLQNGNRSIQVKWFSAGTGGHDQENLRFALAPDPAATLLPGQIIGVKAISLSKIEDLVSTYVCRVTDDDLPGGGISNVGLWAEITNPLDPTDPINGTVFLYAIANFPWLPKVPQNSIEVSVRIAFI